MTPTNENPTRPSAFVPRLFTSCLGLGRLPLAPGTWGSIPTALIFGLMCHFHLQAWLISLVMLVILLDGSLYCLIFSPAVIEATGKEDPGEIVTDELAGQALTFLAMPFLFTPETLTWRAVFAGFIAFRAVDSIKPWPCRRLEHLPAGFGILADDLMAGLYAAIILAVYVYYFGG